jgi:hypothetical protein
MANQINVYGNAPAGEHNAVFVGCSHEHFKGAKLPNRCISGFLLINPDGTEPLRDPDGNEYYAAYTSNIPKGDNPKSSLYKLRQAMLQPYEYDPIDAAMGVPPWEHFTARNPDGTRRIVGIRVEERRCENGKLVSIVTHLRRPRDGVWQDLKGKFEGSPDATRQQSKQVNSIASEYAWILPDGTRKRLTEEEEMKLPVVERWMYRWWNQSINSKLSCFNSDGTFKEIPEHEVKSLDVYKLAEYQAIRLKTKLQVPTALQ